LGAGYEAVTKNSQTQDQLAKKEAADNYERQQQKILQQATVAHYNAQTVAEWATVNKLGDEAMKDYYAKTQDMVSMYKDAGVPVQIMSQAELEQLQARDKASGTPSTVRHVALGVLPRIQQTNAKGDPLTDAQGRPIMIPQVAVATEQTSPKGENQIAVSPAFVARYKKVAASLGQDPEALKPDQLIAQDKFEQLVTNVKGQENLRQQGWLKAPQYGQTPDGKWIQINPADASDTRDTPEGFVPESVVAEREKAKAAGEVTDKERFIQQQENERAAKKVAAEQSGQGQTDVFGNTSKLNSKEFDKRYDAFNKSKEYQNLQTLQGSYQQFQSVVNDINAGKDLTGAQSVVGLFNAIGISAEPLAGKGFRINSNTIDEHINARGIDQAAYAKLLKLKDGDVITPQQMKDYASIATNVYRDAYVNTANEEYRQLGYIDVLPLGNNTPIDPVTAQLYFKVAGGDPSKARTAAQKNGWAVPQSGQRQ
jgi:hypothetical protein